MGDEAAGEAFHADEAHVGVEGAAHDIEVGLGGEIGEGILQCLVESAFDGFYGDTLAVVGDADVAHFTLTHSLLHGFVESAAVAGTGAESRVVELVEVDIVGLQQAKAGVEIFPEPFGCGGASLGAYNHLVATTA